MRFLPAVAIVFVALIGCSVASVAASYKGEASTIYWHFVPNPPIFIQAEGAKSGPAFRGVGGQLLSYIEAQLTTYRHVEVPAVINRSLQEMKVTENICLAGVFKTKERQAHAVFSKPLFRMPASRLILLKKFEGRVKPFVGADGAIDLSRMLHESGLRLGVVKGRSYGAWIDSILGKAHPRELVQLPHSVFARLMLHGRFDYTFGFPFEASYQFKEEDQPQAYVTYPVSGVPHLVNGYFACTDTAFGRTVVGHLNRLVEAGQTKDVVENFFMRWLDERAQADYRAATATE